MKKKTNEIDESWGVVSTGLKKGFWLIILALGIGLIVSICVGWFYQPQAVSTIEARVLELDNSGQVFNVGDTIHIGVTPKSIFNPNDQNVTVHAYIEPKYASGGNSEGDNIKHSPVIGTVWGANTLTYIIPEHARGQDIVFYPEKPGFVPIVAVISVSGVCTFQSICRQLRAIL